MNELHGVRRLRPGFQVVAVTIWESVGRYGIVKIANGKDHEKENLWKGRDR